jgi:membrane protein DedA with SNARE-associated domain
MDFDLRIFIDTYGYLAIFLGSIFDGEAVLLLSGLLSHQNYLSFPWIIFWVLIGVVFNDSGWFLLGKFKGEKIFHNWFWLSKILGKPVALVGKKPATLSFFVRFMYGFRQIIPFSIGMSDISFKKFILLNISGATVWISLFGLLGYILGGVLSVFLERLKHLELILIVVVFSTFLGVNLLVRLIRNMLNRVISLDKE